jgi:hypothetical protein
MKVVSIPYVCHHNPAAILSALPLTMPMPTAIYWKKT